MTMVTETVNAPNDRNNNSVSSCRTSLTKDRIDMNDDHIDDDYENNDIEICVDNGDDDNDNMINDDSDDENIDVGIEKSESDSEDRGALSDPESTTIKPIPIPVSVIGSRQSPPTDKQESTPYRHEPLHDLRTSDAIIRPGRVSGDVPVSALPLNSPPPHPLPLSSLPSLPHLPHLIRQPSQSINLFHGHNPRSPHPRYRSTSPINNNNNNNNNDHNENDDNNNDNKRNNCSPTPLISPKTNNFISKLSFGIDRILNESHHHHRRQHQPYHKHHHKQTFHTRGAVESSDDLDDPANDLDNPHDLSDTEADDDRKRQLLSYGHPRINGIGTNDPTPPSKATTQGAPGISSSKACLPPRGMLPGVDLMSPLSPFHGAVLPRDVCRVDPPSLDILPVRPAWPDVYVCPWTGVQRDRFGLVRRVGHPYQNRTPPKRKKPRTAFSRQQVLELEKRFTRQKYLASAERSALAKTLSMTDAQVKTWFQNRRTKWRRQTAEEREIERQAAHKFLLSLRPEDPNRSNMAAYGALCGVNQQGLQSTTEGPTSPDASPVH